MEKISIFILPIPDNLTIMSLLGHFVVLERDPIQLGIICPVDFQDLEVESVAITINDVFFTATPVTLPRLRDILYTHIPQLSERLMFLLIDMLFAS